jgi:hypothetical protein
MCYFFLYVSATVLFSSTHTNIRDKRGYNVSHQLLEEETYSNQTHSKGHHLVEVEGTGCTKVVCGRLYTSLARFSEKQWVWNGVHSAS